MIFESNSDNGDHTVLPKELDELLSNGAIRITQNEIKDKGRSDALSKGLVLVQTTWFVIQCIARRIEHLPITELELVTLAFAALNFMTYAVWWNKPQNVECPVRVYRKTQTGEDEDQGRGESSTDAELDCQGQGERESGTQSDGGVTALSTLPDQQHGDTESDQGMRSTITAIQEYLTVHPWHIPFAVLAAVFAVPIFVVLFAMLMVALSALGLVLIATLIAVVMLVFPPAYMIMQVMRLGGANDTHMDAFFGEKGPKQIGPFYSGEHTQTEILLVAVAAVFIASIFGGIHCVAWSFDFVSHAEQLLWRIACLTISTAPSILFIIHYVGAADGSKYVKVLYHWVTMMLGSISLIICNLYIIARLVLLVLPFMALRSLPHDAYQTVQWTTFIPHV